ncbi:hypothetical protein E8E14_014460 [Neopestalotiopsis sp. 37M]|nr:hypothetical protein E8E14_014460 [Neopestalotiopsis sp. 37M]
MAVSATRPERITPSLTVQSPLGSEKRGPGLVIVSPAGGSSGVPLQADTQQTFAKQGYIVAHLKLSPAHNELRIRDELREATEALDFHDNCSDKSRYGIIVYGTLAYPSLVEAINCNGEIKSAVFIGEPSKPCSKSFMSISPEDYSADQTAAQDRALKYLKEQ